MQFSTLLLAAVSAITVSADVGGILFCTGADSSGTCEHIVVSLGECHNVTDPYFRNTKTFAPDGDDFYCYPYGNPCGVGICTSPEGCTLGKVDYSYPNKENLTAAGGWDKSLASYECYASS